ncbi:hypothetical protein ECH_1075 [Ehrlichia chaffeensis str. Arkansas]|uniref:Uncharacterized protein n=1 Tax=Ehrlichia chaffeensis (strain ATCC CRL-10679 / Arkansas) TaxID=205920 RepID=Q2GFC3_EHRCR|nr:hypothetical protein ECH_1075 [Ehrlichia chaffeensis str. Arkansas]
MTIGDNQVNKQNAILNIRIVTSTNNSFYIDS